MAVQTARKKSTKKKTTKKVAKKTGKDAENKTIEIIKPDWVYYIIHIIGLSPLITHRFGAAAQRKILDNQMNVSRPKRGLREPIQEYMESLYVVPGREKWKDNKPGKFGLAGHAFKQACVGAARYVEGLNMTYARGCFFVEDDVVGIENMTPYNRQDVVRLPSSKSADIRFRGCFPAEWEANIVMSIDKSIIDEISVFNLLYRAGMSVGVGDWRPSCNGMMGRFEPVSMKHTKAPKKRLFSRNEAFPIIYKKGSGRK
ncbi:hypothetical protein LCGC14_0516730 [marine sediment metagenome]|uniref:Uncharacterized protein n=1 Tax=marine sediment metagenome TaxID=412755 RepID=A0A0F9RZU6_9ZZZZ